MSKKFQEVVKDYESRELEKYEISFMKGLLYHYPLAKKELEELQGIIENIREDAPSPNIEYQIKAKGLVNDPTARKAFKALRLMAAWEHKSFFTKAIEDILHVLEEIDPARKEAVQLKYFKRFPAWKVAQQLHVSDMTVFRWENDMWPLLADRLGI